ncbi:MAG TPA: branched-chain-amino-acid transaminase [Firmicutes bacterium]|nr:branched-chain-amino-acid transaminase [Bacillota bacterium]
MLIYFNGKLVPPEEAKVSVFDHGLLYGDGIFEGIRAYAGRVFKLREHLVRLYESARALMLNIPMSLDEMEEAVVGTVEANGLRDAYIRLLVTRGEGDLGLDPRKCPSPSVIIIADRIALYPRELYEEGLRVITAATQRVAVNALNSRVKSLNYLNSILAKLDALQAGYPESILLNPEGYVVEAPGENVFIVRRGVVMTPPPFVGILEGITRATVMDLARERGLSVQETLFTRHDLHVADECFLTGTACEIIPVVEVDGRQVGDGRPGPITRQLMAAFRELTCNGAGELAAVGTGDGERGRRT